MRWRGSERVGNREREAWLWLALLVTFFLTLWIQGPRLRDPYSVEEDMRSYPWLHRLQDPAVLADDPITNRTIRDVTIGPWTLPIFENSPGYSLLLLLGSKVIDPILLTKLLVFPLLLASVYYLYRIARHMAGPRTAFVLCVAFVIFNLASPAISATPGLQRSFALPLLLALVAYLVEERYWPAVFVLLIAGTIYPPTFVLGSILYGLSLLRRRSGRWWPAIKWNGAVPLLVTALLLVIILFPALRTQVQRAARAQAAAAAARAAGSSPSLFASATYQEGGRRELFTNFPLEGRAGIENNSLSLVHIVFLALGAIMTFVVRPQSLSHVPRPLHALFWASVIGFAAAWAGMLLTASFPLYLPSRYTQAALPPFLLIYVVINARETLGGLAWWLHRQRARLFLLVIPVALFASAVALLTPDLPSGATSLPLPRFRREGLLFLALLLLVLGTIAAVRSRRDRREPAQDVARPLGAKASAITGLVLVLPALAYLSGAQTPFLTPSAEERQLYQYLETLPPDILLGGDPQTLSSVPLLAKRRVLFSEEDPVASGKVIAESMSAYYATNLDAIDDYCRTYGIDYLVVDETDFAAWRIDGGDYLFEPYNTSLRAEIGQRNTFSLATIPDDVKLFQAGPLYVAACSDVAALVPSAN